MNRVSRKSHVFAFNTKRIDKTQHKYHKGRSEKNKNDIIAACVKEQHISRYEVAPPVRNSVQLLCERSLSHMRDEKLFLLKLQLKSLNYAIL